MMGNQASWNRDSDISVPSTLLLELEGMEIGVDMKMMKAEFMATHS
jgi:hypothetical protein